MNALRQFAAARAVSTPQIHWRTMDPAATIRNFGRALNGNAPPVFEWNLVDGLTSANELAATSIAQIGGEGTCMGNAAQALYAAQAMPNDSILFVHNLHLQIEEIAVRQSLVNIRDHFKESGKTLVLVGPAFALPLECAQDFLVINEPTPTVEEYADLTRKVYKSAGESEPGEATMHRICHQLTGLPVFTAEQAVAESLYAHVRYEDDLLDALQTRTEAAINLVRGVSVYRGPETFESIGGNEAVICDMKRLADGRLGIPLLVWLDEVEKSLGANLQGDNTGISQDFFQSMLTYIADNRIRCKLFLGVPGSGKSAVSKAMSRYAKATCLRWDMGGMKSAHAGESETAFRNALALVHAKSGGNAVFVATSNDISGLPPEFISRFSDIYFFDLPSQEERAAIWPIYLQKYNLEEQPLPDDGNWTGREIEKCCAKAWELCIPLVEAARSIVPVAIAAQDRIAALRREASGRYLSASYSGVYQYREGRPTGERKMNFDA